MGHDAGSRPLDQHPERLADRRAVAPGVRQMTPMFLRTQVPFRSSPELCRRSRRNSGLRFLKIVVFIQRSLCRASINSLHLGGTSPGQAQYGSGAAPFCAAGTCEAECLRWVDAVEKVENRRLRKSRESRILDVFTAARLCRTDSAVRGRFCVKRYVPNVAARRTRQRP